MESLTTFFNTLADNVVVLIVLMPLVGSLLVRILAKTGREAAYYTAIMNAWLTMSLAVVMVCHFDTQHEESNYQMVSSINWSIQRERVPVSSFKNKDGVEKQLMKTKFTGPDIRLAVGVDGLSVWFVFLVVAGNIAAVYLIPYADENFTSRLSWTLLAQSAMAGSFAALDAVLLCLFVAVSVWCLFLLVGMSGGQDRREAARRFFRIHAVSSAFLMLGLIGMCVSYWWMRMTPSGPRPELTFALDRVIPGCQQVISISSYASDFWPGVAPWLFLMIMIASALRAALPPFHHWWYRSAQQADRCVVVTMMTGFLPFGFYLPNRFVIETFPSMSSKVAPHLATWGAFAILFIALASLSLRSLTERLAAGVLVVPTAVFCFSFANLDDTQSAMILSSVTILAAASALLLLVPRSLGRQPLDQPCVGNQAEIQWPYWQRVLAVIPLAAFLHLPFSGSFWGDLVMLKHVFGFDRAAACLLVISFVLIAVSIIDAVAKLRPFVGDSESRFETTRLGLIPLLILLAVIAVAPHVVSNGQPIDDPTSPTEVTKEQR